jgi:hypothetical protein
MLTPWIRREHYRLSVTDSCRWRDGDGPNMRVQLRSRVVNIAHIIENFWWSSLGIGTVDVKISCQCATGCPPPMASDKPASASPVLGPVL